MTAAPTPPPPPIVDVLIPAASWKKALPAAAAACKRAARAAWARGASAALKRRGSGAELSIVLTGDAAIRKLNAAYRKKDKPTNVLSFPSGELILGDVVIAYGTVAKEAKAAGKSLKDHLSHMVVHGVLHLLGYDHETASDAKTMERLETKILSHLGIADPYHEPAAPAVRKRAAPKRRGGAAARP